MNYVVMRKAKRKNAKWRVGVKFTDIEKAREYAKACTNYYTKICTGNYKLLEKVNEK